MAKIRIKRVLDEDWLQVEWVDSFVDWSRAQNGYVLIQDLRETYGLEETPKPSTGKEEDVFIGFPDDKIKPLLPNSNITKRIVNPERDEPKGYGEAW
jgi:hypothetical protein